jgi:hypothetical protein
MSNSDTGLLVDVTFSTCTPSLVAPREDQCHKYARRKRETHVVQMSESLHAMQNGTSAQILSSPRRAHHSCTWTSKA